MNTVSLAGPWRKAPHALHVLAVLLVLSMAATWASGKVVRDLARAEVERENDSVESYVAGRMARYESLLRALSAALVGSAGDGEAALRRAIEHLDVFDRYGSVSGIGFVK